ncbi:MAG: hypothetical protein RI957_1104 [Verrucomicrobiota bacterium]
MWFISFFTSWILVHTVIAEELTEEAKIEALIEAVGSMNDASFIRNGSEYSAKNAAKFLRGKWDAQRKEVRNAKEFIEKVATQSSTTGKPYLIRTKGAIETPCAAFLQDRLKKIESGPTP